MIRCYQPALSLLACLIVVTSAHASCDLVVSGQAGDFGFGITVVQPGDLNGDGHEDLAVGATTFDAAGGAIPGRVYVYFGGPGADATPDVVLTGESVGDRFGYALAAAGDVNGDGSRDLIVGAYQNDARGANAGRAYVYFGGPGLDSVPDLVLNGATAGDQFGIAVAGVGDVNGDGRDDLLVGARFNATGGFQAGRAYVFFGGTSLDAVPDLVITSTTPGERFGFTVARAGDVNGDWRDDFLVGAYLNSAHGLEAGRAYVFFGGPGVDATSDLVLDGESAGDHFSDGLAGADVNGDGRSDILVGASQRAGATGRAYV